MKCPNCGYETNVRINPGTRYRNAVLDRLTDYGYTEWMTPDKYKAYNAVRGTISILTGVNGRAITESDAEKAISALDSVLPRKGA